MKTKQLREIAKEQGYYVKASNCDIRILIFYKDDFLVASVSTSKMKDLKIRGVSLIVFIELIETI